ncbi:hypothetical protein F5887DRAFT_1010102 [Amanita rubescens]|nr:hypothetical protein F5887DRAFT_1010102 [Amanita rubescens]
MSLGWTSLFALSTIFSLYNMRLLLPFTLFILSFTISAFPVRLNSHSGDGLSISISKRGSAMSSGPHHDQPHSCTEGPVQKAWRRAFRDPDAKLPQNVFESTDFRHVDRSYMTLIMVIKGKLEENHEDAIEAFQHLNMLLGLGHDPVTKQWFIVIKRVGDFAVYLDPPKSPSKTLEDKLEKLISEEELWLIAAKKVTVLETVPQFYTFYEAEGRRPRALPIFGAIGKYFGDSPPSFPKVEEFCSCNQHVHRTV